MRILITTTSYPRFPGDHRSPFIYDAASSIKEAGCQVQVLAMHIPGCKTLDFASGILVHRPKYFPERWEVLQQDRAGLPEYWKKRRLGRLLLIPFFAVHTYHMARLAAQADIIHANWTISGFAAWVGQILHRKPFIVTVHGSDIFQLQGSRWMIWITSKMLKRAERVITVSHALRDAVEKMGVPKKRIEVISDGVNVKEFFPDPHLDKRSILFIGSITEKKGVRILLQAFHRLIQQKKDERLVIIGDGPIEVELKKWVAEHRLNRQVEFMGSLSRHEVADWLRKAKLLILPSYSEGFGVVLVEALASGTPVIASRIGGIPDIVSPDVGRLVEPGNVEQLADTIMELIEDEDLLNEMSHACRAKAINKFNLHIVGSQLKTVYHEVLDCKPAE